MFPYLNFLVGCLEVEIIIKLHVLGNGMPFKLLILQAHWARSREKIWTQRKEMYLILFSHFHSEKLTS